MGRENGAFVRSFPRKPTEYDPRDRPWYILAREHPGQVSVTDPYKAVTTDDVNIGIETPVLDRNGTMIGVIGADITLVNLTSYITRVGNVEGGEMILVDRNGMILANRNSSLLYSNVSQILGDQTPVFLSTKEGMLVLNRTYLIYYTSPELGWKIGTFVPFSTVDQKINDSIMRILLFVLLALVLLSVITLIVLHYAVIRPLTNLTNVSRKIAETGDLDQTIETGGAGEIGTLAGSFKAMVGKIHTEEQGRKQVIKELEERNAELARFTYTISHELRSPLITIRGFSGLIEAEVSTGGETHELKKYVQRIAAAVDTMDTLLADLLRLSMAGRRINPPEPIGFGVIAREAVDLLARPLAEHGVTVEIAPDLPEVYVDQARIREVMVNLIENAIKFSGDRTDRRIRIGVDMGGAMPVFFVQDNGIGINPRYLERIFNLFERLNVSVPGTGIGLPIVRRIIEAHGGKIWVESEGEGEGTTFRFTLPVS